MMARWITKGCPVACALGLTASIAGVHAATLAPLASFGGGDGWRAPGEVLAGDTAGTDQDGYYKYLNDELSPVAFSAGNVERGFAYNPTTGNLVLVSRSSAGNGIRLLNGTTGADVGALNQGVGVIAGGTFTTNMVGVADDGAIYVANLSGNTSSTPYNVYRWDNESAAGPTLAFSSDVSGSPLPGARLGDSFDVIGSGANTRLVAGYGNAPSVAGNNSFALFSTANGADFTSSNISIASSPPVAGDFRLGITFTDSDTVIGKQSTLAHVVNVSGTTGTLSASFDTDGETLRAMDFAIVDGRPLLAIMETSANVGPSNRARIFIYDMTNPALPVAERKIQEGSNLPIGEIQEANSNGTGQVKFGAINGNVATIYAMSTNNGLQAFQLTLDPVVGDNADFDGSGTVDGNDFLTWQRGFGLTGQPNRSTGDANGDGNVNAADLTIWKGQFGTSPAVGAIGAVPEPSAIALAGVGIAALGLRRRQFSSPRR